MYYSRRCGLRLGVRETECFLQHQLLFFISVILTLRPCYLLSLVVVIVLPPLFSFSTHRWLITRSFSSQYLHSHACSLVVVVVLCWLLPTVVALARALDPPRGGLLLPGLSLPPCLLCVYAANNLTDVPATKSHEPPTLPGFRRPSRV